LSYLQGIFFIINGDYNSKCSQSKIEKQTIWKILILNILIKIIQNFKKCSSMLFVAKESNEILLCFFHLGIFMQRHILLHSEQTASRIIFIDLSCGGFFLNFFQKLQGCSDLSSL
jgi:hypothetical protein